MQNISARLVEERVVPELRDVIVAVLDAAKTIAAQVARGAVADVLGSTEAENVQGETQKKLDVIANNILKDRLCRNRFVRAIASEEEETIVPGEPTGKYLVAFDPLDGSSNIDVNGQIGTIFSVLPATLDLAIDDEKQFFQTGDRQVCAGYVLYGASCVLVITTGKSVDCYTLDPQAGDFLLTKSALQIPHATQEFSVNMANQRFWSSGFTGYIKDLLQGEVGERGKRFNMRWNAAMVGDVHRVLMRGGIFLYPSDARNPKQPAKLRLLYEANPMALLVENAGGKSMTEDQKILAVCPEVLHQRVPVILGSAGEVDVCMMKILGSSRA